VSLVPVITGVGGYLPEHVLTNVELGRMVETSDEWIRERTGIERRHIAADGETTSDLAFHACAKALERAGLEPGAIDLIVLATATPDLVFPSTASLLQARLGAGPGAAFDVHAVCSGFIYALAVADSFLVRGQFRRALVVGAETFSRIFDWSDRSTCVLFGDGAGAVVLEAKTAEEAAGRGVLRTHLRTDGRYADLLYVDGGPSKTRTVGRLRMSGSQVFRHAVSKITDSIHACVQEAGVSIGEIDWFVPHQANQRILSAVAEKIGVSESRFISTVALHGNTSAASVPLALDVAMTDGRIRRGDLILMEAIGGGLAWGSALVRI